MARKSKKFKRGERLEIICVDHTSDDSAPGWRDGDECLKESTPERIKISGYLVGETKYTYVLAMASDHRQVPQFATLFHVIKGTVIKIKRG